MIKFSGPFFSENVLYTFLQGALGAMTFGAYHQYTTQEIMKLNNEKQDIKQQYELLNIDIRYRNEIQSLDIKNKNDLQNLDDKYHNLFVEQQKEIKKLQSKTFLFW